MGRRPPVDYRQLGRKAKRKCGSGTQVQIGDDVDLLPAP
jgi:hypothetical protein